MFSYSFPFSFQASVLQSYTFKKVSVQCLCWSSHKFDEWVILFIAYTGTKAQNENEREEKKITRSVSVRHSRFQWRGGLLCIISLSQYVNRVEMSSDYMRRMQILHNSKCQRIRSLACKQRMPVCIESHRFVRISSRYDTEQIAKRYLVFRAVFTQAELNGDRFWGLLACAYSQKK